MRGLIGALLAAALGAPACGAAQDSPRVEFEAGHGRERLTDGRSPWTDTNLALEVKTAARQTFTGRWRETERFGLGDREGALGMYLPFGVGWSATFEYTGSPTHQVLPRYSLFAQVEKQLSGGWGIHAGLRHSEYTLNHADLRLLTIERYVGNERLAYTFYSGKPEGGGWSPSHRLQWSHFFNDRDFAGISAARGREVENIVPGGLLASDVRNLTLFGRWWIARHWALSGEAIAHEQGSLYRRHGFRLGLRHQF